MLFRMIISETKNIVLNASKLRNYLVPFVVVDFQKSYNEWWFREDVQTFKFNKEFQSTVWFVASK